jgi:hypothetical protein
MRGLPHVSRAEVIPNIRKNPENFQKNIVSVQKKCVEPAVRQIHFREF